MPAVLASAGTVSLLVLAVIAVGATVLAILFGQLTRRVPNSDGGLYAYARYEFGDGTPGARAIRLTTPAELRARSFPAGSMGPKVEAACRFVEATGKMAAIGRPDAAAALLRREAGTIISP
jgi:amino acid transporter